MKPTVLIVDDDRELCHAAAFYFHTKGYRVSKAFDGQEGLNTYEHRGPFDVVITDFCMPRLTGAQMLEAIFKLPKDEHPLGVVMCSADPSEARRGLPDHLKLTQILWKPVEMRDLEQFVERSIKVAHAD